LDEALSLAVGARSVGPGEDVLESKLTTGGRKNLGAEAGAIVGHDLLELHAEALVMGGGFAQEGAKKLIELVPETDIVVNNIGIYESKDFADITDEDWFRYFETNLLGGKGINHRPPEWANKSLVRYVDPRKRYRMVYRRRARVRPSLSKLGPNYANFVAPVPMALSIRLPIPPPLRSSDLNTWHGWHFRLSFSM
jgi:NAD(P)-dependent dehydrogenase (short-subunit alcohol dehydrogenase family)